MKFWNKFNRRKSWFISWALIVSLGGPSHAEVLDRVIAKVNDEIITLSEVQERATMELSRMRASGGENIPSADELMAKILSRMIEDMLLLHEGKKLGIRISDERVLAALDEIKRDNGLTDDQLEEMLKGESQTLEDYRNTIRDQILLSKVVSLEIKNRIVVGEKRIQNYYEKNKKEFWQPGKVTASHILFILDDKITESEKKKKEIMADKVLQKIREGVDFADLAKAYSEDGSAQSGGDLGELERGKMVPALEQVVFAMKQGEVSGIIRSPYGMHIIKVNEIIRGRTQPLDEVRDQIINVLRQKRFKKAFASYMANLKKNAFIENHLKLAKESPQGESKVISKKSQSRVEKRHEVANILPPLKRNPAVQKTQVQEPAIPVANNDKRLEGSSDLEALEGRLREIKKMREGNVISEEEYQKRKREVLDGL